MSILRLVRPEILKIQPYSSAKNSKTLRLHANELPWSALENSIDLNFYPEKDLQDQLQKQLAQCYQVEADQLMLTRGSDDGIDLVTRLFLNPGQDACMQFSPTFSMYSFYVSLQQAQLIECPLNSLNNFQLCLGDIRRHWQNNCKVIFLCNPNNPTANLFGLDFIAMLCEEYKNRSVIVVDEAYIEFAEAQSATCLIPQFDNLIVLRTLSKAYGLANLRLGIILSQAHILNTLKKIIGPYPLSNVVLDLALRAMGQSDWFSQSLKTIKELRTCLIKKLQQCTLIEKVYPTQTNFILVKTPYAKELFSWLADQGIAIKSFSSKSSLQDHLRITVGSAMQNQVLIRAVAAFQNNVSGKQNAKNLIY